MIFRNPNEAIRYLEKMRTWLSVLRDKNSVTIQTSSGKNLVIDLSELATEPGSIVIPTSPKRVSRNPIDTAPKQIRVVKPELELGEFQNLNRVSEEYRKIQRLLLDLDSKESEWSSIWGENPHMENLLSAIKETRKDLISTLSILGRKLNSATSNHMPNVLKELMDGITKYLQSLGKESMAKKRSMYFENGNADIIVFTCNYKLQGLETHKGIIPSYIVATSYRVDVKAGVATAHLTTMIEYDPNHGVGRPFKNLDDGVNLLNTMMELDRVDLDVANMPFPDIGLTAKNLGEDWEKLISDISLNDKTQRLFIRTTEFLPPEQQTELMTQILTHIPEYLKKSRLKVDTNVELFAEVIKLGDRHKDIAAQDAVASSVPNLKYRVVHGANRVELYMPSNSFRAATSEQASLKRAVRKAYGRDPIEYGVRNVFSFAVGSGGRSDARALREFIEELSHLLQPDQILKVRKALGV